MSGSVLVVEDEPLIRFDAVEMLEEAGLNVVEFDSAVEAAQYMTAHAGDVAAVFTDVNLKGDMDGFALAHMVARTAPEVLMLVTSGRFSASPPDLPKAVRFMKKPWLPLEVLTALQQAVAIHDAASA